MKTNGMKSPLWLRVLLYTLSPTYRREWADLERRSHVTGVARQEKVIWRGFGYQLVVNRATKMRHR